MENEDEKPQCPECGCILEQSDLKLNYEGDLLLSELTAEMIDSPIIIVSDVALGDTVVYQSQPEFEGFGGGDFGRGGSTGDFGSSSSYDSGSRSSDSGSSSSDW